MHHIPSAYSILIVSRCMIGDGPTGYVSTATETRRRGKRSNTIDLARRKAVNHNRCWVAAQWCTISAVLTLLTKGLNRHSITNNCLHS